MSAIEAVRDSVTLWVCFGISSGGLLRSCEIRGILVSKIVLVSFVGWEDKLTEGDEVGCRRDCVVRVESVTLLEGLAGVAFADVPVLEEEEERVEADEVGHGTGVDFVGEVTRGAAEDLAEGDLDARGDFERFNSFDDKLLEDSRLISDFADGVLGRGERGDGETTLDTDTGSDFTFATGKSGLLFIISLLLVLSFSSLVLFDSNNVPNELFGRIVSSSLTLIGGTVLVRSSSVSSFLTFSFTSFLSFSNWCSFGSLISTGTSSTFILLSSSPSSVSVSVSSLSSESSCFCSG